MLGHIKLLIYLVGLAGAAGYFFRSTLTPAMRREYGDACLVAPIAMILVGIITGSYWLFIAIGFALVPIIGRTPAKACQIYLALFLLLPSLMSGMRLGGAYMGDADMNFIVAIGLFVAFLTTKRSPVGFHIVDVIFLMLLVLSMVAAGRGTGFTGILRVILIQSITLAIPYYVFSRSIRTAADLRLIVLTFAGCGTILAVISAFEAYGYWPIFEEFGRRLGFDPARSQALKMRGGLMRAAASFPESTSYAIFLVMAFTATLAMRPAFVSPIRQLLLMILISMGLLAAQARGAFIGFALALCMIDLARRHYSQLAIKLSALAIVAGVIIGAASLSPRLSETLGLSGSSVGSIDYRVRLIERGKEEIRKAPLLGQDMTTVLSHLEDLRQGEGIIDIVNGYLAITLATGLVGLVIFVFAYFAPILLLVGKAKTMAIDDYISRGSAFVAASLSAYALMIYTNGYWSKPVVLSIILIALGRAAMVMAPGSALAATPRSKHIASDEATMLPLPAVR